MIPFRSPLVAGKLVRDDAFMVKVARGDPVPEYDKLADGKIALNPVYGSIQYSSVWTNQPVGFGHGLGRLNSLQAWSAAECNTEQWFQVCSFVTCGVCSVLTFVAINWTPWILTNSLADRCLRDCLDIRGGCSRQARYGSVGHEFQGQHQSRSQRLGRCGGWPRLQGQ